MPCGALLQLSAGASAPALSRPRLPLCRVHTRIARRAHLLVRAAAEGPLPDEGPREVSLVRQFPGAGYSFMLAGALKIMTIGWVATGAPRECVRTVAGQYAQFLLLPVGLLLCLIAKKIVDAGLHESRRFMTFVLGITAFLYFGLYSVLYRYEPRTLSAQQRIQAAATHNPVSPYAEELATGGGRGASDLRSRRNKFIIQRQLEGEYEALNSAYYARAPEMQMEEVSARVGSLPQGMLGAEGEGAAAVGSSVAQRRTGDAMRRAVARRAVPSMYETTSRMPELDESDF